MQRELAGLAFKRISGYVMHNLQPIHLGGSAGANDFNRALRRILGQASVD